jgi:hypothetical protein
VSPTIARQWANAVPNLKDLPGFAECFLPGGRAPGVGERFRSEAHATTLERIAATGGDDFYRGDIAGRIAAFARACGALMTEADLAAHRCDWVGTVSTNYQGYDVHEIPPNGQGLTALLALNLIEQLPYAQTKPGSAERMHLEVECMRAAFADLYAHVADPEFMKVTAKDLLSKSYAKERAKLIDPKKAGTYLPGQPPSGGTIYLCATDTEGRAVTAAQDRAEAARSVARLAPPCAARAAAPPRARHLPPAPLPRRRPTFPTSRWPARWCPPTARRACSPTSARACSSPRRAPSRAPSGCTSWASSSPRPSTRPSPSPCSCAATTKTSSSGASAS